LAVDFAVTFFLDEPTEGLEALDSDRDWRTLQRGEHAWILQTFLRLRAAGMPVRLHNEIPTTGMVVFHAKQRASVRRAYLGTATDAILVETVGDISPDGRSAHAAIMQNAALADGERRFFMTHWPQPGLRPRDSGRGTALRRLAYKGFDLNLDPYFRSDEWQAFLTAQGIEWVVDSVAYAGAATEGERLEWPDFVSIDAVLAMRPSGSRRQELKPATKLYNAWLAGVPALLGPEVAFRELRQSPLDYLEIQTPEDAKTAVLRLRDDPGLYGAMVEHGQRRAQEFGVSATVERWRELLTGTIPERAASLRDRPPWPLATWLWRMRQGLRTGFGRA
jgi:hypothetical protein